LNERRRKLQKRQEGKMGEGLPLEHNGEVDIEGEVEVNQLAVVYLNLVSITNK